MKAINSKRAKLLYNMFNTTQLDMNIGEMVKVLFSSEPSFTEELNCSSCMSSSSYSSPILCLNDELFSNDFAKLEIAVLRNLPTESTCKGCKKDVQCKRQFGPHIFIDVSMNCSPFQNLQN